MELNIVYVILGVLMFVAGIFFQSDRIKRDKVKEKVEDAAKLDQEGAINASIEFADRVKKAEEAVDAAIDARPDIADPAARVADRIRRSRDQRRDRRARQRYDAGGS